MTKPKRPKAPPKPTVHVKMPTEVHEGMVKPWNIGDIDRYQEPTCHNGAVSVHRYRVIVEEIDEPLEVIQGRIRKLWRLTDNFHHTGPIQAAAALHGMAPLDYDERGVDVVYEYRCQKCGTKQTGKDRYGTPDKPCGQAGCQGRMGLLGRAN